MSWYFCLGADELRPSLLALLLLLSRCECDAAGQEARRAACRGCLWRAGDHTCVDRPVDRASWGTGTPVGGARSEARVQGARSLRWLAGGSTMHTGLVYRTV